LFFSSAPLQKGRSMTTRVRTLHLPALLLIAAAVWVACAAAVITVSREAEATFPGKNGKIAYMAFRLTKGTAEIYTINPGRGGKTQLTHNNTHGYAPSYSPNGKKIAYVGYKGNAGELYAIDVGGGGKTSLTNTGYNVDEYMPSWGSRP
jgi:dipeptidyl aminopeptidase/acylaminoacyl peptidase